MTSRATLALLVACGAVACGGKAEQLPPAGQVLLYVTTDAPLPNAPGTCGDPSGPPPLFDRLRLDIFAAGQSSLCDACSREVEVYGDRIRDGVSMGIVPTPGQRGPVARARLFRASTKVAGEPPALSTIDVYAQLPEVGADGIVKATILLRVDDLGQPRGSLQAPTEALAGEPTALSLWPGAQRLDCTGPTAPSEACVPGGAFWLGNPQSGFHTPGGDANESRLVVLRPFFIDLREVTVAEYRSSKLATLVAGSSVDPLVGKPSSAQTTELTPFDEQYYCTYSDEPLPGAESREHLPVNCVSWEAANAYCRAQGKRLPSEAEWEYVAGGLRSSLFVWGSDGDDLGCADGVWQRAGTYALRGGDGKCSENEGGPSPPGSGERDRLALGGREVVDLMGNVSEWTRDLWNRTTEPCWLDRSLLENPECTTPSTLDASESGELHTVKGSTWVTVPFPSARRRGGDVPLANRGFRCVRDDR